MHLRGGNQPVSSRPTAAADLSSVSSAEPPDDVEAIDFAAALRAARAARQAGASPGKAMANVDLVLAGEVPFVPVPLPLDSGTMARNWLGETEAKLRLHEAVTMKGNWDERDLSCEDKIYTT